MKNEKIIAVLFILILLSDFALAENGPEIAIQKSEGRTEAVVTSQAAVEQKPKERLPSRVISAPGDMIVWMGRLSSASVGKVADDSIRVVQTLGGFFFAPVFRTLDIEGRIRKSREAKN